jgi:hypothetical protein
MQGTEQEILDEFQRCLQERLSIEMRNKHYSENSITIPGSAAVLFEKAIPYFEEEQKYHRMRNALANLKLVNETEISQSRFHLENLIEKYEPRIQLNKLCDRYYKDIIGAVIPIGNSHIRENYDNGLKALTRLSKIKVTRNNIANLTRYVTIIEEHYTKRRPIEKIQEEYNNFRKSYESVEELRRFGFFEEVK